MDGNTILARLDQDEIWTDKYGVDHILATMNPHHRASLLPFLLRQAERLQQMADWQYMVGLGSVDNPSDGMWAAQLQTESELALGPTEWLARKPLVRKLIEYENQRTPLDRLQTKMRNRTYKLRKRLRLTGDHP